MGAAAFSSVEPETLRYRGVRPGLPALYKSSFKNQRFRRLITLTATAGEATYKLGLVLATPSLSTDTWIIAALEPPFQGKILLECDPQAERDLVRRRLLRLRDGEVKKPAAVG